MKSFLLCLVIMLCGFLTRAQTFIAKGGATFSASSQRIADTDFLPGIGFSLSGGYIHPLTKNTFLQVELGVVQNSYQSESQSTSFLTLGTDTYYINSQSKKTFALLYAEIPVVLNRKLGERLRLIAGPVVGIGLGGRYHTIDQVESSYFDPSYQNLKGNIYFKKKNNSSERNYYFDSQLRISVQAGFSISVTKKVFVDFRYNFPFTNLIRNEDSKILFIVGSVGYRFEK